MRGNFMNENIYAPIRIRTHGENFCETFDFNLVFRNSDFEILHEEQQLLSDQSEIFKAWRL